MNKKLLSKIAEGYKNYLQNGERSNTKLVPIHGYISEILQEKLGNDFIIKSLGYNLGKEHTAIGKFYNKDIDIAILRKIDNIELGGIGIKFITSNYKQNANNYFENMMGETVNLRRNNFIYSQLIIFKEKIPYFEKAKDNIFVIKKIETINDIDLLKYINLNLENNTMSHKSDLLFILFIKTGDEEIIKSMLKKEIQMKKKWFYKKYSFSSCKC